MSNQTIDLNKELTLRKEKVLDLKKSKGIEGQKAEVVLALDYSYSMETLYQKGHVQTLTERLLPIGMAFDDNQEVDFYLFQNNQVKLPENLTVQNIPGYINNKVIGKYSMGGTQYAPVLRAILNQFAVQDGVETTEIKTKKGFFGGTKTEKVTVPKFKKKEYPTYVIFITDGDNSDKEETERVVREMSRAGIFIQFVGIGSASFPFLEKLDDLDGRFIDNANFFTVGELSSKTDDQLYGLLLNEFPQYVKEARTKGLIN
jgi:hypothetical protein